MGIAKFNRVNNLFTIDTKGFKFFALKDLKESETVPLRGLYINPKSKYGASPFAASDGFFISLPSHLLETVSAIMDDAETVALINEGKCGIVPRSYVDEKGETHYSADFVDV